jgi:prevent-host-death family protein
VSITDAKNGLSALIDRVRAGEPVLILDRGDPVATLEPIRRLELTEEERISNLERRGLIRRGRGPGPGAERILREPPPDITTSLVEAVLEERRSGR